MTQRVICPRCQAVLSVREDAPARITCLRCLANVVNPNAVQLQALQHERAVPAIPIDNEIGRDLGEARYVLGFLSLVLIVGGVGLGWLAGQIVVPGLMILTGILVAMIASIWQLAAKQRRDLAKRQSEARGAPAGREGPFLEYEWLPEDLQAAKTPYAVQATTGFVAWVAGVVLFVAALQAARGTPLYLLRSTFEGGLMLVAAILILLGGMAVWLKMQFKWTGFVPGLLLGLGVTCLLPVGILLVVCGGMLR